MPHAVLQFGQTKRRSEIVHHFLGAWSSQMLFACALMMNFISAFRTKRFSCVKFRLCFVVMFTLSRVVERGAKKIAMEYKRHRDFPLFDAGGARERSFCSVVEVICGSKTFRQQSHDGDHFNGFSKRCVLRPLPKSFSFECLQEAVKWSIGGAIKLLRKYLLNRLLDEPKLSFFASLRAANFFYGIRQIFSFHRMMTVGWLPRTHFFDIFMFSNGQKQTSCISI